MTPQEALEALKIEQIEINGKAVRVAKFFEGISVANDALEKQIPKKVNNIEVFCDIGACIPKQSAYSCGDRDWN